MKNDLRKAIAKIISAGFQISPEALDLLSRKENAYEITCKVIESLSKMKNKPLIITPEIISNFDVKEKGEDEELIDIRQIKLEEVILFDPTEHIFTESDITGFINYFVSRFKKIRRILMSERFDVRGAITIKQARNWSTNRREKVKIIGMIANKKKTAGGGLILELEDLTGVINAIVSERNRELLNKAEKVIKDEVVCIEGNVTGDVILVSDIMWPEIPIASRRIRGAPERIYAVLISDLHIGSRFFMRSAFNRFILWINGRIGTENQRKIAKRIKYIIIAGDIVDGIGVYPGQEKELLVKDLKVQYKMAAEYLAQIPEHITIIIIPGNHDATRQALPSPAIFQEYAAPLYDMKNVKMLGDPAYIKLYKTTFLITHGKSLDDILAKVPGVRYDRPAEAMIELLRRRHLAPVYGERTQLAPEAKDLLVIEKIPDVFHAGHVHTYGYLNYRGVLIVNSGAWQEQTDYMKSMGVKPNPGKATIVDISTGRIESVIDFSEKHEIEIPI
ncbi:MAG: DNA-directed DNA polymerase II small subunit [archaeon GB-1867-035]|mgnify:CR=1 FL=1|nr:DNA-directed DNA polymerase II small subunit [Candidatus Culexmicrobium profundum]